MRKSALTGVLAGIVAAILISGQTAFADPNFVSWWKFDEGSGTTAYDSAGSNNGTIIGATWTTGQIGGALSFDGSDDYVNCGYGFPSVAGSTTKTITAWAKSDITEYLNYGRVIALYRTQTVNCFSTAAYGNPATWWFLYTRSSGVSSWSDSGIAVNAGQWTHIALVQNGTDISCYINGLAGNGASNGGVSSVSNPRDATIGNGNGTNFFDGKIDDVRIYDRVLSAEETWQLYLQGLGGKAFAPNPIDGATGVDIDAVLSWSPGENAASHDVYLGTDYSDVNDANTSSPEYKGNFDVNSYDPCGLEPDTVYYWRIDAVNEPDIWKGDVWSFESDRPEIGLSAAQFEFTTIEGWPNPADQILGVSNIGPGTLNWQINEDCEWLSVVPSSGSSTGEINDVILSVDIAGLTQGVYECNLMISDGNASNSPQIVNVELVVSGLISWWKFDEGSGGTAYDSAGNNDGNITGATWTTGIIDGALSFDGSSDCVFVGDKADLEQQAFTLSFWAQLNNPSGSLQGGIAKGYIFGSAYEYSYKLDFSDGTAYAAITNTSNAAFGVTGPIGNNEWHMWTMAAGEGTLTLYKDGINVNSTGYTGTIDYDKNNNNFVIGARSNGQYSFNGKIDDVRIYNRDLSAEEIEYLYGEHKAFNPAPENGATGTNPNLVLSWHCGIQASSHDVYLGTNYNDVNEADTNSPEYKGNFDVNSFDPCGLELSTTYYWRVDEVNEPNLWKGNVWSFETGGPEIGLSATQFQFTAIEGGANPADQILGVSNSGAGTLNWQINEGCDWLSAEPNSGSSTGETDEVTLSVDISGLAGVYTCELTVSDANASNNPQTAGVTLYVRDADGQLHVPSEYPTIQGAINTALNGETVIVSPGTYNENIAFGGKIITVRSTNPDNWAVVEGTVIQGDGTASAVTFSGSESSSCTLTGFKITGGSGSWGGGIGGNNCSATISKCIITGNHGAGNGGGIGQCKGLISNCVISGNSCSSNGGGILCYNNCSPTVKNCLIIGNTGDGVLCMSKSSPVIVNCTISGNSGNGLNGWTSYIEDYGHPKISNSIIWANGGVEIYLKNFYLDIKYCDIEGGISGIVLYEDAVIWSASNNIAVEPLFVDAGSEDYRLECDSPCIDTGTNNPTGGLPGSDLDGQSRPIDGDNNGSAVADIGVYEFVADSPIIGFVPVQFEFFGYEAGSNPASQILSIRNRGIGSLNWEVTEDCSWLTVSPSSGTASSETDEVTLAIDLIGLASGSYNCEVTITSDNACNSGKVVEVNLIVYGPEIGLSATQFQFTADEGGANPNEQILSISNVGGGILKWGTYENCSWLSVEPNSGSSTGETDDVNLSVDISGLGGGIHTCELTVSDANASNNPQTIGVTLSVYAEDILLVPSEYGTIQAAIDASVYGNTIIVAPGTYTGAGNYNLDFGGKALTVRSTNPEDPCVVAATVIDCQNTNGRRGFYFHNGEGPDSIVSGLTIKRGRVVSGSTVGGGICCIGASPTIKNCIIRDNILIGNAMAYGGGIYGNSGSNPSIINCIITNNTAQGLDYENTGGTGLGGGVCLYGAATIKNCIITNNTAVGGYGYSYYGYGFGGDGLGGGIGIMGGAATIENCIIADNTAAGGGGDDGSGSGIGGGIASEGGNPTIRNCTIANNNACGIVRYGGSMVIISSIIWGNDGQVVLGSGANVTYSDIEGGHSGTGNINDDPCFIEPGNGNYHLHPFSPCKNTGDPSYSPEPGETDIDGESRVMWLRVDMGADEISDAEIPIIEVLPEVIEFFAKAGGANPEEQILSIRNSGTGTLTWEAAEDCTWLSVEPNSGSSTGEVDNISLGVDISGLTAGIYTCELTVSDANASNNPQTAVITLHVGDVDGQLHVPSEYSTIQTAIDIAFDGDAVIVAPGTYTGTGNKNLDFGGKAITVRSTDPEDPCVVAATVIDCANSGRGFYFDSGEGTDSIVSGLTIKGGKINNAGGGIYCEGSSPTIEKCIIHNNEVYSFSAPNYGGGIYCGSVSNPIITNCTISSNEASGIYGSNAYGGGIYSSTDSNPTIINCTISNNLAAGSQGEDSRDIPPTPPTDGDSAYGGGIYGSTMTIENCIITNNTVSGGYGGGGFAPYQGADGGNGYGGGIYYSSGGNPTIEFCTISYNTASGGGGGYGLDSSGGSGGDGFGGGIYNTASNIAVENGIVSNNAASGGNGGSSDPSGYGGFGGLGRGGGIYNSSSMLINNVVINNNTALKGYSGSGPDDLPSNGYGDGGGLYGGSMIITFCTVLSNSASDSRGGIYFSSGTIKDSIIWGNGDDLAGSFTATYCCIEDNDSGTGNIHSDPCFATGPGGDYYLSQIAAGQAVDSPCVDAGSDTAANLGMDIKTTRTDSLRDTGTVDMGYHYLGVSLADLNGDLFVDFIDYAILAADWLQTPDPCEPNNGDINKDDQVDIYDLALLAARWLDCLVEAASAPYPVDGTTGVEPNVILQWTTSDDAIEHDVYLGTDANAVAEANHLSAEFMGTFSNESFDLCFLDLGTTYFWRIDEVGPKCIIKGDVWDFTTWYLAGWWKFDEGSGVTAYDSAGDNDGTINGATWTTGQIGGALHFDGYSADDYVSIPDGDNSLDMDNEMTITAWIKPTDNLDVYCIAGKPTGTGFENNYMFLIETGLLALYHDETGYYSTSYVTAGVWQQAAVTLKEGGSVKFYINGAPAGTSAQTTPFGTINNEPLLIGKWLDGIGLFYGDIDEVRIYNVELTAEEVEQIYEAGL